MYENLKKFVKEKEVVIKEKKVKPSKAFKNLSTGEKHDILEEIARDLGYID